MKQRNSEKVKNFKIIKDKKVLNYEYTDRFYRRYCSRRF